MPLVRSIAALADGWAIATSNGISHVFTSAQLTAAQKLDTLVNVEPIVAAALQATLQGAEFVGIHLTSVVPLRGTAIVSNSPLAANWWVIPT
jgi:hypothetical protein